MKNLEKMLEVESVVELFSELKLMLQVLSCFPLCIDMARLFWVNGEEIFFLKSLFATCFQKTSWRLSSGILSWVQKVYLCDWESNDSYWSEPRYKHTLVYSVPPIPFPQCILSGNTKFASTSFIIVVAKYICNKMLFTKCSTEQEHRMGADLWQVDPPGQ